MLVSLFYFTAKVALGHTVFRCVFTLNLRERELHLYKWESFVPVWRQGHAQMPEDTDTQKPVGPFEDFEACVRHFESDEQVDDPEALCGWMEQNKESPAVEEYRPDEGEVEALVEAMKEPQAESVLTDLEVTYVSGVENPAQDSRWVMAKDAATQDADWGVTAPIVLHADSQTTEVSGGARAPVWAKDGEEEAEEQQKAWAPVLIPHEVDKQGDVIPPESIEKAAHEFLATFRKIDTDHDLFEGKGSPIESWTLKEDTTFTLPDGSESREYPKGTWMMGVRFVDQAWERIKSGELTGFSIYGEATSHEVAEVLGGDADLEVGAPVEQAAKQADSTDTPMELPDHAEKQLGADELANLAEAMRGYFEESGSTVEDASLQDFFEWAIDSPTADLDDTVEIGGVQVPIRSSGEGEEDSEDGGDEEEEEQSVEQEAEENEEDSEMEDKDTENEGEGGESDPSMNELLEEVRDTVKNTQESVEQHGERLEALEDEVFEKDEDTEPEGEGGAEDASTEDVEQAAEEAVKSMLGLDELPDDPEERQEVVRKHLHEQEQEQNAGSNPETWDREEAQEVVLE